MKKTKLILPIIVFVLAAIVILFLSPRKQLEYSVDRVPNDNDKLNIENAIVSFLEDKNKHGYTGTGKLFCAAKVHWQHELSPNQRIVYAIDECFEALLIDGDLRGAGGGGDAPLFKMRKKGNLWEVEDSDNRMFFGNEPITQDWVRDVDKLVPEEIKSRCLGNCFSTEGVIDKAAKYYNIEVPQYPLNRCKKDNDCESDSVCVLSSVHSNPSPNTCVRKCTANKDCGVAHTCRGQCVNGENGCPYTYVDICVPDLFSSELEKYPEGIIR